MLALQVINRLKKRTGKALPLTALLEAPTIEALAGLIEPRSPSTEGAADPISASVLSADAFRSPPSKTLITIRPAPSAAPAQPPLFFVHDGNGETLLYRTLALLLQTAQPIYGLQPDVRPDGTVIHTTIKDMAAAHVAQIRKVQPQGPYCLAGLCAGGVIAFEMARQLEDAGETTAFVGLIDAGDAQAKERPLRIARARLKRLVATLTDDSGEPAPLRFAKAVPKVVSKLAHLIRYEVGLRLDHFRNARRLRLLRQFGGQPVDHPDLDIQFPYLKVYEFAHREHVPEGVFQSGRVVVFRATSGNGSPADMPYIEKFEDPLLGWQRRVSSNVVCEDVPGGHSSMLQEPHVRILANKIAHHVAAALRTATVSSYAVGQT